MSKPTGNNSWSGEVPQTISGEEMSTIDPTDRATITMAASVDVEALTDPEVNHAVSRARYYEQKFIDVVEYEASLVDGDVDVFALEHCKDHRGRVREDERGRVHVDVNAITDVTPLSTSQVERLCSKARHYEDEYRRNVREIRSD